MNFNFASIIGARPRTGDEQFWAERELHNGGLVASRLHRHHLPEPRNNVGVGIKNLASAFGDKDELFSPALARYRSSPANDIDCDRNDSDLDLGWRKGRYPKLI